MPSLARKPSVRVRSRTGVRGLIEKLKSVEIELAQLKNNDKQQKSKYASEDARRQRTIKQNLMEHRRGLEALGLDPDLIGEHEVKPIHCKRCGHPVPWKDIKGHR
jgi:hypothetical protein